MHYLSFRAKICNALCHMPVEASSHLACMCITGSPIVVILFFWACKIQVVSTGVKRLAQSFQ